MREHGTTSAYYIIRVMAAMFVVVYLLLFIVNVMTTSRVKRFTYDSPCMHLYCIQTRFDLLTLTFAQRSASILYFLFSFLFRRLSSLSLLLEVGLGWISWLVLDPPWSGDRCCHSHHFIYLMYLSPP